MKPPAPETPADAEGRPVDRFPGGRWLVPLLSVVFWVLALTVWGRVGDVSTDAFNDLTTAMRLEAGEKLYQSLQWLHGPVPPLAVTGARALWGRTVDSYLMLCALTAWAEWLLAWRLVRRFTGAVGAVAAISGIWIFFTFEPDVFSRFLPVNYSSLLAATLVLVFFNISIDWDGEDGITRRVPAPRFFAATAVVSLTLVTKVEFGLAVWAALLLAAAIRPGPAAARLLRIMVAGVVPVAVYGAVALAMPGFWEMTSPGAVAANRFGQAYLWYGGAVVSVPTAIHFFAILATSSALLAAVLAAAGSLRGGDPAPAWYLAGGCLVVVLAVNGPDWLGAGKDFWTRIAMRTSFAWVVTGLGWGIVRGIRDPEERKLWPLYAGALLLLSRTPNQLLPARYGAFYLVPAVLLAARPFLDLVTRVGRFSPFRGADVVFVVILGVALFRIPQSVDRFGQKAAPIAEATEPVRTYSVKAAALAPAAAFLQERLKPGDRIVIVPNEPVLYYATGAGPAWPDHNYIGHLVRGDDEGKLAALAMKNARFVILTNRPYIEFGAARAGTGFAEELKRRLDAEATLVAEFVSDPRFAGTPDAPKGYLEPFYRVRIWETGKKKPETEP